MSPDVAAVLAVAVDTAAAVATRYARAADTAAAVATRYARAAVHNFVAVVAEHVAVEVAGTMLPKGHMDATQDHEGHRVLAAGVGIALALILKGH